MAANDIFVFFQKQMLLSNQVNIQIQNYSNSTSLVNTLISLIVSYVGVNGGLFSTVQVQH